MIKKLFKNIFEPKYSTLKMFTGEKDSNYKKNKTLINRQLFKFKNQLIGDAYNHRSQIKEEKTPAILGVSLAPL